VRQHASLFAAGAARRIYCYNGMKDEHGSLVVSHFEFLISTDTVEKLDFLPRSQFLRQQAGFKRKALRVSAERLTFRCAAALANWRWQRVALSALHDQTPIF
jgi:hypothetical protein